jgi:hypothetical protein
MAHESLQRPEQAQGSSDRAFGFVFALAFVAIGAYPWFFGGAARTWALGAGVAFATAALVVPGLLGPANRLWALLGKVLHKVMSPLVLGAMFFLVVTPMGIVMRWLGKDPLRLRFEPELPSYWLDRTPPGPQPSSFSDQF